jgi:hypothetical protein
VRNASSPVACQKKINKLHSNLFKFKYFYLITELSLGRLLLLVLHGCWLVGAAAWLAGRLLAAASKIQP